MHIIFTAILSLTLLTSCNNDSKVHELESRVKSMEEQILGLQKDLIHQKIASEYDGYTFLEPGDQGFSTLKLDVGAVTVAMKDVQEYANGSKVTLSFGKPHTAQINKVKFDIDYGPLNESGSFIENQKKTKTISISEPLMRATWTQSTVILEGVMPAQLGRIKIFNPSFQGIELFQFKGKSDGTIPTP